MTTAVIYLIIVALILIAIPVYIGWKASRPVHVPRSAYVKIAEMLWHHMIEYESRVETLEFSTLFEYNDMAIELLVELHVSYDVVRECGTEGEYWNETKMEYCDLVWYRVSDPDGYEIKSDFCPETLDYYINNY